MYKDEYPLEWHLGEIQADIRKRANHTCEHCGMVFKEGSNKAIKARNKDGKPVIGTVHHINGVKSDCSWENLVYLCQRCHLEVQALWEPGGVLPAKWHGVPSWITVRNLPYRDNSQLSLF